MTQQPPVNDNDSETGVVNILASMTAEQKALYRELATFSGIYRQAYHAELNREQIANDMIPLLNSHGWNVQTVTQVYSLIVKYKNAGLTFAKPARKQKATKVKVSLPADLFAQLNQIGNSLASARQANETANV